MSFDPARELYRKRAHEAGSDTDVDSFAMWSFISSLGGLWSVTILGLLMIPLGVVAVVLGVLSFRRINSDQGLRGKGFAITGIILGSLSIVVATTVVAFFGLVMLG